MCHVCVAEGTKTKEEALAQMEEGIKSGRLEEEGRAVFIAAIERAVTNPEKVIEEGQKAKAAAFLEMFFAGVNKGPVSAEEGN